MDATPREETRTGQDHRVTEDRRSARGVEPTGRLTDLTQPTQSLHLIVLLVFPQVQPLIKEIPQKAVVIRAIIAPEQERPEIEDLE